MKASGEIGSNGVLVSDNVKKFWNRYDNDDDDDDEKYPHIAQYAVRP
jgi:hypothetical protein